MAAQSVVLDAAARWVAVGFPAKVFAVTRLLQPETKAYQKTLETLLRSK